VALSRCLTDHFTCWRGGGVWCSSCSAGKIALSVGQCNRAALGSDLWSDVWWQTASSLNLHRRAFQLYWLHDTVCVCVVCVCVRACWWGRHVWRLSTLAAFRSRPSFPLQAEPSRASDYSQCKPSRPRTESSAADISELRGCRTKCMYFH
jgi:hypothetical protein